LSLDRYAGVALLLCLPHFELFPFLPARFTRFFAIPVDHDLVIEVEYGSTKGRVVPFVVRLMADIDGRKMCISRFDSAHLEAPPHRDVLGLRSGLRRKEFYEELDYGDAVKYATEDFKRYGSD
jgi:hypothetical protein